MLPRMSVVRMALLLAAAALLVGAAAPVRAD